MTIDDFQISGIRHAVMESLKSAVIYLIAMGPRSSSLHSLEGSVLCLHELSPCFSLMFVCCSGDLVIHLLCRAGEVGSLDLRSSRGLIHYYNSAGTGSVLLNGVVQRVYVVMVRKIFSPFFGRLLEAVFCSACPLFPYDIGSSFPSLS